MSKMRFMRFSGEVLKYEICEVMIEKSRRFYTGMAVGAREQKGERQLKYHDRID